MRLRPEQVAQHLEKGLAPVYLIAGDEPQQLAELSDAVRKATRKAGFDAREILSHDTGFEWNQLAVFAGSLSVFADKKVIDLRLSSATPGAEGSKALTAYCQRLPEDTVLLVTMGKLPSEATKSRWFQALDKAGVVIQVWPLEGKDLLRWLELRMQQRGMQTGADGLLLLASRIEGNLLAAAQEIEKLYVLYGAGQLSREQIIDVVADSSRYDVYKLVDTVLSARIDRIVKVLQGLRAEGIAVGIVLWALTREARTLIRIGQALASGQDKDTVFRNNHIWDKRQSLVGNALNRLDLQALNRILVLSAKADRQFKGQQQGDAWETVLAICLTFASAPVLAGAD